jgi:hypothetical protein
MDAPTGKSIVADVNESRVVSAGLVSIRPTPSARDMPESISTNSGGNLQVLRI